MSVSGCSMETSLGRSRCLHQRLPCPQLAPDAQLRVLFIADGDLENRVINRVSRNTYIRTHLRSAFQILKLTLAGPM